MAMSGGKDDGEPMMEMNTTPLIDVLLVLLIMFIITIPVQTHAVKIDLPVADDSPQDQPIIDPVKNRLGITATNQIIWNDSPVSLNQVRQYLAQTKSMVPEPELQFQPDPLSAYLFTDSTLAVIKESGVSKFGFVGNEQYGSFNKASRPPN
ncbi:biopolymer transporter ExbD [Sphingopyxis sp. BSNA05]|uniref:ExbD/TolR family protein n=1 Tax=Sphingomonadales TaxID=204457 RepID=UPI000C1EE8D3|nr:MULTISPECIES: biopolymer transporter ExbD [Sphingomonadaceae]ATW03690.1 biopolymer transporter ExbD [Sphingorhabdus sp. YGSMI21]NRD90692.1 biopolymer transporter ExbD [Sphingopyxis sp. BSNA05]